VELNITILGKPNRFVKLIKCIQIANALATTKCRVGPWSWHVPRRLVLSQCFLAGTCQLFVKWILLLSRSLLRLLRLFPT